MRRGQQTRVIGEVHVINASTREATRETLNTTPGDMRGSGAKDASQVVKSEAVSRQTWDCSGELVSLLLSQRRII